MADVGVRNVTKVTLFRNGDPNFNGKHIVVNPRHYRNFESFLDTATFSTQCTSAVTRICTPLGRHKIESVEQLADGGTYVAVGRENFKRLKYGQPRPRKVPIRLPPVWRNHLPSSGRFRKVYEGERQALKRIYVYRNGDNITPARMILLKKRMLTDMELVLAALQESGLDFDFAISKLFTLNGRQIHDCDEIVHDRKYVAIERGSRFKPMNYKGHGEISPRYASTRLPPLVPQNNNSSVNRSPKKQVVKPPTINKPRPPPPPVKQEKKVPPTQTQPTKKQKENKRSVVPNQQSIVSISQDDNRDSFSNVSLSTTPPPLDESPDFTLPTTNKAKESGTEDEKLPEIGEIPRDIDDLPKEEQESLGAHIYKASGMQREWGDMIKDSRNIPDKTLDNAPAEEVVEEIMEDIEDVTEVSETTEANVEKDGKKEAEERKKTPEKTEEKVMEITEEVVETLVDEDEKDGVENEEKKESNNEAVKQERSDSEASRDNEDKSDEESEEEKDEDSADDDDGDETKVDDNDKMHESDAVDNDDKKDGSTSKNLPDNPVGNDGDNKVHGDTGPAASDDKEKDDEEDDDDDKDDSPAVSQNPSRRSSQEMNSEDEVKSEDEVDEEEDEKDDDDEKDEDDDDDDKSEEEESEDEKDEEDDDDDDKEDEDDASSVASEPEDDASNADSASEKEEETTEENATKENKTNQKVEKQRAQPKAKGKPDMIKGRSTKTRDVNKA